MSCVKCGAEIAPGASECPRCGVVVSKARYRSPSSTSVPALSLDDSMVTAPPKAPKAPFGLVTETMIESLENTRSWVRIIAISSACAFVLVLGAGAYAYFAVDAVRAKLDNRLLITFAAALSVSAFSFLLVKDYASAIERIRGDQPTQALEDAIAAQERIWRIQGALTLLGWLVVLFLGLLSRLG